MTKLTIYRDQEIRFTVHDSPDYYNLKVSVFNDDKKTELIGETWVALEQIVVPGGGQNDVWHTLNCKGRYAGEIRIELTYYDTRPREEKTEKRRQSAPMDVSSGDASLGHTGSGVGGPRQPKAVKRRPLPADPTNSSTTSPTPYTPPNTQQSFTDSPNDYENETTPPLDRRYERFQNGTPRGSLVGDPQNQQHSLHTNSMNMSPSLQQQLPEQYDAFNADSGSYRQEEIHVPDYSSQAEYSQEDVERYESEYLNGWPQRPPVSPVQPPPNSQGMIHSHSSPAMVDARPRQGHSYPQQYPGSSPSKNYSHEEMSAYQPSLENSYDLQSHEYIDSVEEHEAPPPPPVHRNSGSRATPQFQGTEPSERYAPIPDPAPLNIRNGRGSITGSPLSQVQSQSSHAGHPLSPSPSDLQSYSQPPSVSSRTSYSQPRVRRSQSPIRDHGHSVPPSLVPGYEPSIAEDESERIMHEKRMSARHQYSDPPQSQFQQAQVPTYPPQPQYQQIQTPIASPQPQYQQEQTAINLSRPVYQQAPAPIPQSRQQPQPRNVENVRERRVHRSSAPVIHPQITSPDPRTPVRKSVSPHPGSAPNERRHSEIPFSPDSFDAYNPSINSASSVNDPGARYNTPEQAREASRQHERQEKMGDGPIIGSDGRIIDPSDHLPTDTWAPEPEQKTPKKGPQVTMRFRHSPQGAQPMPAARRPAVEHSMSTPIYTHNSNQASPVGVSPGRARLQKKSGVTMGQPASSPLVPTLNNTPRSSPLRPSEPNYALRERENHGGYGSSPTYGRPSPGNVPPPIPGKVPIGGGQEDWDTSALSEEMRRIDIGVGGGQNRQRRSRYV